jgi:4-amino-4-deoxy-L-arabinose transferase-like glycosyltransferase
VTRQRLPSAVWGMAAFKVVVHVASTAFGYHRDELYFVTASKRLAASYVDFQPAVPVLVAIERAVLGDSLVGLRLIPALAGGVSVVLAALIARELGGDRRAQLLAAFALMVVPLFVGMFTLLNTVSLETPAWLFVVFFIARLIRTGDERWWLAIGASIGLALLVKFTVLAYLFGLACAVLATPSVRRHLRTPWPWVGAAIAAAMMAPSMLWQASNDFAVVEFVRHQGGGGAVAGLRGREGFLVSLALLPGPLALWVWVPGLRDLLRRTEVRLLGVAHAAALLAMLVASGKGYYAAPGIAVLLAAGAVALSRRPGWSARRIVIALAINLAVPLAFLFPGIIPISVMRADPNLNQATELGERLGWEDLAATTARVFGTLPPGERSRTVVLGINYAIPSAIEFYADRFGLPVAVSGHNSAYLWWPELPRDHVAIAIGFDRAVLRGLYEDVERVGTIRNRHGVVNYEWGDPVFVARGPKVTPDDLRARLKNFEA